MKTINILVIDAQGGGVGKAVVSAIKKKDPSLRITAVGSNSVATAAMLKAGANQGATGENAVRVCAGKADYIIGPIGIIIPDSMNGEISAEMALAVAQSRAKRVLIPFRNCDSIIAGMQKFTTAQLIQLAIDELEAMLGEEA